jgi:hypothetical protein
LPRSLADTGRFPPPLLPDLSERYKKADRTATRVWSRRSLFPGNR